MKMKPSWAPTEAVMAAFSLLFFAICFGTRADAHNITHILAKLPEFSTFNHYLTSTNLAAEINSRQTITVCAVENSAMSEIASKSLQKSTIKNILSLHVLLDYFDSKKLHQVTNGTALAATMFQATGSASGSSGFVNITDLKGGKVGFEVEDKKGNLATYVKSLKEIPYNISVIQISSILHSSEAEAPTPSPSELNLTSVISNKGCKVFADKLLATEALKEFEENIEGGLTVFCPLDDIFKKFEPKYTNLTEEQKKSLILFHGVPVYHSISMLKSNNGLMNTLATDGAKKFDFTVQNDGEQVTLKTKLVTAKITGTLLDKDPVAIYTIDKVLMPEELFNATEAPTPAPAPAPEAEAPKAGMVETPSSSPTDSPAYSPDDEPADQMGDDNGSVRFVGGRSAVFLGGLVGFLLL